MKTFARNVAPPRRGFSLVELLVAVGVIGLLAGVFLTVASRSRKAASTVNCTGNLRQLYLAFTLYAADNDGRLPDPFAAGASWEQLLRRYMSDGAIFRCEADPELFNTLGSSYDWRDTGDPGTTMAGRRLSNVERTDAVLVFDALPGWHSRGVMNAALMNGAVRTMKQEECLADLQMPVRKLTALLSPLPVR